MIRLVTNKHFQAILIVIVYYFFVVGGISKSLEAPVHRDVSIYLMDAKMDAVFGTYLKRVDWGKVAENLKHKKKPRHYRRLSRYGNTVLLSIIYRLSGGGIKTIITAKTIYSLILLGFFCCLYCFLWENFVLFLKHNDLYDLYGIQPSIIGVVLFFMSSRLVMYLNGNLVSEVPCLLASVLACYCFILSLNKGQIIYGILSGGVLFIAYLSRLESVLITFSYIACMVLFFLEDSLKIKKYATSVGCCLGSFLICWGVYFLYVGSIANPYYFFLSVLSVASHYPYPPQISAQNFMSTIGWMCCFGALSLFGDKNRMFVMAWSWFSIMAFPFCLIFARGAGLDARFFSLLLLPLSLCCLMSVVFVNKHLQSVLRPLETQFLNFLLPILLVSFTAIALYSGRMTAFMTIDGMSLGKIYKSEKKVYPFENLNKINGYLNEQGISSSSQLFLKPDWDYKALMAFFDAKLTKGKSYWLNTETTQYAVIKRADFVSGNKNGNLKKIVRERLKIHMSERIDFRVWNPADEIYLVRINRYAI